MLPPTAAAALPPGGVISEGLKYVQRVPGSEQVAEGKLDRVAGREVLVTTGRYGFRTYDVTDPANPRALDSLQPAGVLGESGYWQDEDMALDRRRKLIIGALDPRHDAVDQAGCPGIGPDPRKTRDAACKSGFYVISYRDPRRLRQIGDLVELPVGHTATCIEGCRYVWTGGPARRDDLPSLYPGLWTAFMEGARGDGRPIWVTDLRDPRKPKVFRRPIDVWRNDGATDYSHDVQVDRAGIAWVSGRGGIRGYATHGRWRDPYTDRLRKARPWSPVLVAGGGVGGVSQPQNGFMHNSLRPLDGSTRAAGVRKGHVLIGTEEDFSRPCEASGRIVLSDLGGSFGGEPAASSTRERPYRMRALDTFHPAKDGGEAIDPSAVCSAHYFELSGSMLGVAWLAQGLRLLDISDARDVRQVGYYRVTGTDVEANPSSNLWDLAWNGRYLYLFDMSRGIEVLKLRSGTAAQAVSRLGTARAPPAQKDPLAPVAVSSPRRRALVCPLLTDAAR